MQFQQVIGQFPVKKQLVELVQHNRLSHALLFLGKEGTGGLPMALALAQYIVCEKVNGKSASSTTAASLFGEEPGSTSLPVRALTDACGSCPSCQKAAQLVHPDIHFSYPTVTRKPGETPVATDFITEWREFVKMNPYGNLFEWVEQIKEKENSQGKITAKECEDIIRKLSLKSFESEYKIMIIWMPEELEKEGNKLLKIIEEPPLNTLFILVAENEEQILPTIVSRCQLIRLMPLDRNEIEEALISRNKTEPAKARQISGVCDGNYREALQMLQHAEEDWEALLRDWLNAIKRTGPLAQAKWVDEVSRLGREKQKQFLRYFNHMLEQAIHLRVYQQGDSSRIPDSIMPGNELDLAERLNKIAAMDQQEAIIKELDRASYYIERNAHGKMLFHALTIKLYHILQDRLVLES
ncbi:MAG: hypothetical protein IPQ08_08205 [Chitinophagaceae bacterium]|nr:hypothetical protein [Chitinophagaceae bacterium]